MRLCATACVLLVLAGHTRCWSARHENGDRFPAKPIKVVVYTSPGGLIDVTTRKFIRIAAKYTRATFAVENTPGAGGIVALKQVLRMPADGYTLYACTKSNISKIVATGSESNIELLDWIARLMTDPECVITRTGSELQDWEAVVADARARPGAQVWVGPAMAGLDHVTAIKTWEKFGIQARWVPFASGEKAKGELLGGRSAAYVGNPGDVLGNPDLHVAVVSSPSRLVHFPDAPTFREFGVDGLDHEFMWRGFAVKKGCPAAALAWYDEIFRKVNADQQWRTYWEKGGTDVQYLDARRFTPVVREDAGEFARYLAQIGVLPSREESLLAWLFAGAGLVPVVAALFLVNLAVAVVILRSGRQRHIGEFLIPMCLGSICLLFLGMALVFPETDNGNDVGARAVPALWICLLVPLNIYLLYAAVHDRTTPSVQSTRTGLVWIFALFCFAYGLAVYLVGYFLSSFLFLVVSMYVLGQRRRAVLVGVPIGWLFLSYWVFVRLLEVPLPVGRIIEEYWS